MIEFFKMSGSGNDFILIDNRDGSLIVDDVVGFVKILCERKGSVGADGLIIIENSSRAHFRWRFFNADGSEVDMCGNGGRCAARFAYLKGIAGPSLTFETVAGVLSAQVNGMRVKLEMTEPRGLKLDEVVVVEGTPIRVSSLNTGVPHAVHFAEEVENVDVVRMGRAIRNHPHFAPAGTNVNFVRAGDGSCLVVRTYERGVEDETLACGTGVVASSLISAFKGLVKSPVSVQTRGGEVLRVHFEIEGKEVKSVFYEGEVHIIYEAEMWEEAYR